ncbi:MAG: hypothetical protein ACOC2Q_05555, partial [Spirochaetota bacterium]
MAGSDCREQNELDFRVRRRDRYSVGLKFRHLLDPERSSYPRRRTTRIRVVFFLPYSFNIRPETFEPERLYDDVKLYVRFNTPELEIDELLDPESRDSPLMRIARMLEQPAELDADRLRYEAKLLGAIVKSVLRDTVVGEVVSKSKIGQSDIDRFSETVTRLDRGLSRYRRALDSDGLPPRARAHLLLVDEHISLTIENYLIRLLTHKAVKRSDLSLETLRDAVVRQQHYRRDRGYPSVVHRDSSAAKREEYIYRSKVLKHYVSSVLFFEINRGNQGRRVEHILYAIAAGIAMAIATGISFLGQIRFGTLSTTLFLVLVAGYMIKDRMKDAFRLAFQRTLGRLFYDRRTKFKDQHTHKAMGLVKERAIFVRQNRLDEPLLEARARGGFESAIMETNPESALKYTKLLRIYERRLHRVHRRIAGLADINIIDLKNLL